MAATLKAHSLALFALLAVSSPCHAQDKSAAPLVYETPAMPANPPASWLTFHLVHPGAENGSPGDPNGIFFWKGRYHLHYIHDNKGFSFAHVSSTDMVHWKWHPTTLTSQFAKHGMFSGTGFITQEGRPAQMYHGYGSGKNWIIFSLDDELEKWTSPEAIYPRDENDNRVKMKFWDPDCWLMGGTYYSISGGKNPILSKSADLKTWRYLGPLFPDDFPAGLGIPREEDVSCANFFKLGNKWMLLCISHRLGCRYYLGDFKNEQFLPVFHALMSWNGRNFFAPESVLTPDGRRVMWSWLMELPLAPGGVLSLPRELDLPGDGLLRIRPLRELDTLRQDFKLEEGFSLLAKAIHPLKSLDGHAHELELTVRAPSSAEFGLNVLCDKDGANGVRIALVKDGKAETLQVGKVSAPFALKEGEDLTLRVFIDKNLVEVFANDRQAVATAMPFVVDNTGAYLFNKGDGIEVTAVKSWKMKSIYAGN